MSKWTDSDLMNIATVVSNKRITDVESTLLELINLTQEELMVPEKRKRSTRKHSDYQRIKGMVLNLVIGITAEELEEIQLQGVAKYGQITPEFVSVFNPATLFTEEEAEMLKLTPKGVDDLRQVVEKQSLQIIGQEKRLEVMDKDQKYLREINKGCKEEIDKLRADMVRAIQAIESEPVTKIKEVHKPKIGIIGANLPLFKNLHDQLHLRADLFLIGPGERIPEVDYVVSCDVTKNKDAELILGASKISTVRGDFMSFKVKLHDIANRHFPSNS